MRCPSAVHLQVHFRRKRGSRLRCSPPSPSSALIPPKSTPSPDHGKSLNPTFPSSLPAPSYHYAHRRPPPPQHPTVRTAVLVGRSPAWSLGRPVPLWTSIHPVHAEKRRGRGRARVFTELTWTCCVQAKPESTFDCLTFSGTLSSIHSGMQ